MGNFLPRFNSKNIGRFDANKYTREELIRETRRLSNLAKSREKQLKKHGYASQELDVLKLRNEATLNRDPTTHYGSEFSVYRDLTKNTYEELIINYQKFLKSKGATIYGVEEEFSEMAADYSKKYGKDINSSDLSKVFAFIKHNDVGKYLSAGLGSDDVIDNIFNSDQSVDDALSNLDRYIRDNPSWDAQGVKEVLGL